MLPVLVLVAALAVPAFGSPVRPDIQKLLSKPHAPQERFAPARAGWDGPESGPVVSGEDPARLALDRYGPAAMAREARANLIAAAAPDPKIWGCLAMLILLLRQWLPEKNRRYRPPNTAVQESNEISRPAA
jgi:hypothetical protein